MFGEWHEEAMKARRRVLLRGAPGCGKTLWARNLSKEQRLWTVARGMSYIWRAAGLGEEQTRGLPENGEHAPVYSRIFRAPHHSISKAGMVGRIADGWLPVPGELSLAHGGVLFLDEVGEFRRDVLEETRSAWKNGWVLQHTRDGYGLPPHDTFVAVPACFHLVVSMTRCPCGYYGESSGLECKCTPSQVRAQEQRAAWFTEGFEVVEMPARYPVGLSA